MNGKKYTTNTIKVGSSKMKYKEKSNESLEKYQLDQISFH